MAKTDRAQAPPAIRLSGLSVSYGKVEALIDISASIYRGARVAVIGPNGAGKSTLFKAILGMAPITAGQVMVHTLSAGQNGGGIAYLPQRGEVDWRFPVTVIDVVLMGRYGRLGWLKRPGAAERVLAGDCLEIVGMGGLAGRPIRDLSGGQQQRVFLARALVQEPEILILDEPFAGVDNPTQESLLGVLDGLPNRGITSLVATHDLSLASTRFEQVMLLNRHLIAFGPPSQAINATSLAATFSAQVLFYADGQGVLAVADHCCPPGAHQEEMEGE
jgi:ABC-type Mn2+/Zn2+ transport system ATPase subunit